MALVENDLALDAFCTGEEHEENSPFRRKMEDSACSQLQHEAQLGAF
jgi:hypothetical protein